MKCRVSWTVQLTGSYEYESDTSEYKYDEALGYVHEGITIAPALGINSQTFAINNITEVPDEDDKTN